MYIVRNDGLVHKLWHVGDLKSVIVARDTRISVRTQHLIKYYRPWTKGINVNVPLRQRTLPTKVSVWKDPNGVWTVWVPHLDTEDDLDPWGDFYFTRYDDAIKFATAAAKERFPLWYEK